MAEIVTVDYLLDLFQKIHDSGDGDMKIKCRENFLYEDEIGINYMDKEVTFRGYIYNLPITQKVKGFCEDIDKAYKKFYGVINELEMEEK